jgi:predicted N-formylglutamate amidohydrolase
MIPSENHDTELLAGAGSAVEVVGRNSRGRFVFACEHASNQVPTTIHLGVDANVLNSHAAWDPGAVMVARLLAKRLDATLVAARFSRLVCDCNRPPDANDFCTVRTEIHEIPGNVGLSSAERAARSAALYEPFHASLAEQIERRLVDGIRPILVTIHSFSPTWNGVHRGVELGLLHDSDPRLVDALLPRAAAITGLRTARNQPYGPEDGVTHTLQRHALPAQLPNVMIEIRNDLIASLGTQQRIADGLAVLLARGEAAMA